MKLSSLNPLRCDGTPLPPPILLMCKLIVFCLMLRGYVEGIPEPFLPMLPMFDAIPRPDLFRQGSILIFLCASVGLLFNRSVRTCALLAGAIFLLQPLTSRVTFFYGNFFCASMLILSGLYDDRTGTLLHRAQFSIMYFGAGLGKLLDPDWHNGQFIDFWLSVKRPSALYESLASGLPERWFAGLLSWSTIVIEFALAIGLMFPKISRTFVWCAIVFHTGSVVLSQHDFGVFIAALLAGMLVFASWPERGQVKVLYDRGNRVAGLMKRISGVVHHDGLFDWRPTPSSDGGIRALRMEWQAKIYTGYAVIQIWLLLNPLTYFVIATLLCSPNLSKRIHITLVQITLIGGAFCLFPWAEAFNNLRLGLRWIEARVRCKSQH